MSSILLPVEVDGKVGALWGAGIEPNDKKHGLRLLVIIGDQVRAVKLEDIRVLRSPKKLQRWERQFGNLRDLGAEEE